MLTHVPKQYRLLSVLLPSRVNRPQTTDRIRNERPTLTQSYLISLSWYNLVAKLLDESHLMMSKRQIHVGLWLRRSTVNGS